MQNETLSANLTSAPLSNARVWIGGDPNATVYLGGNNSVQHSDHYSTIIGLSFATGSAGPALVCVRNRAGAGPSSGCRSFSGTLDLNGQNGVSVGTIYLING